MTIFNALVRSAPAIRPIFYDLEFTGAKKDPKTRVREFAAYDPTRKGRKAYFSVLLNPLNKKDEHDFHDTSVNLQTTTFNVAWPKFKEWLKEDSAPQTKYVFISHVNYYDKESQTPGDKDMLVREVKLLNDKLPEDWKFFDSLWLANMVLGRGDNSLQRLAHRYKYTPVDAHKAKADVDTLYNVFKGVLGQAKEEDIYPLMFADHPIRDVADAVKKLNANVKPIAEVKGKAAEIAAKVNKIVIPIFYDTETTGLIVKNKPMPRIIQIAAYTPVRQDELARFSSFVNPEIHIEDDASEINHIYDKDVVNEEKMSVVGDRFITWLNKISLPNSVFLFIAHNNSFDQAVLRADMERSGLRLPFNIHYFCTRWLAYHLQKNNLPDFKQIENCQLQTLRKCYKLAENKAHRADGDVEVLFQVWEKMIGNTPVKDVLEAALKRFDVEESKEATMRVVKLILTNRQMDRRGIKSARDEEAEEKIEDLQPSQKRTKVENETKVEENPEKDVEMKDVEEKVEEVAFVPGTNALNIPFDEDDFK